MTKQALIELRDNIAAGDSDGCRECVADLIGQKSKGFKPEYMWVSEAMVGSLDAAVAFLEAVLPGSDWVVRTCDPNEPDAAYAHTWLGDHPSISGVHHEYWAATPARALLLATLDALIARAE